jgi:hypothetical protein
MKEEKMATEKPAKEMVIFGAGAVIDSNQVLLVEAFAKQDLATIKAQMVFFENLAKTVASYRAAACKQWDNATSGYMNSEWLEGTPRLVKKDPDKPRGRKPVEKPNPAKNC